MADDHTQRAYRSNEYAHESMKTAQGSDPLAELARLIGQNDPFAEFGRKQQPAQQQPAQHSQQDWAPQPYPQQAYDQHADVHADHSQAGYAEPVSQYDSDPYYQDGAYQNDQPYDDVPPPASRRRLGILAIAAVAALAVVGTAGAVGYRALFGSSGSSPPPVIKADVTPSKVVPPTKSEQSNKLIYDRVGERSSGEKIVSREERPLDINKAPQAVAFPNALPAAQPMTAGSGAVASADQPKKIHTIAIRPDQPMSPEQAQTPPQPQAAQAPPTAPQPRAAPPQRLASAPQVATADAEAPVARAAPVHQAPPPRNAPLSLSPNAAPAPAAPVRTASVPPPARSPAPAASAAGQYAVQISSQRSEAEAQAAFRALQAKYPSQLGSRQPIIRRADLGSKGIYYRALVGPFADGSDAVALCQSLKSAGGSCLIQKN
jgi:hypothetical protein